MDFYNLDMILAIGYRVRSHRGVQFRSWASGRLRELPKVQRAANESPRASSPAKQPLE